MIGGVGYLDFKNVSHLKSFAKKILVPDNDPFKEICQKPTGDKIDEFYTMRNYLAHYSYAATRKLESVYKKEGMKNFASQVTIYFHSTRKTVNDALTFTLMLLLKPLMKWLPS